MSKAYHQLLCSTGLSRGAPSSTKWHWMATMSLASEREAVLLEVVRTWKRPEIPSRLRAAETRLERHDDQTKLRKSTYAKLAALVPFIPADGSPLEYSRYHHYGVRVSHNSRSSRPFAMKTIATLELTTLHTISSTQSSLQRGAWV